MTSCKHTCCLKITRGRHDIKLREREHTHVYEPLDCPSCYIAGIDYKVN